MIVTDLEQNTPEWLEWRRSKIGASDSSIIAGQNKYKDIQWLWRDKLGWNSYEDRSVAAKRGHDLEPLARRLYEQEYSKVEPKLFVSDTIDFMSASVDGYSEEFNFIIEIKCPMRKTDIKKAANGFIKPEYYAQIQHQLFVTKANYCDLVVFDGLNQIYVNRIFPNQKYQRKLVWLCKWFWAKVQSRSEIKRYAISLQMPEV